MNDVSELISKPIVTMSARQHKAANHSAPKGENEKHKERATVREECPNCKNDVVSFTTAQLRSADEGQTIFYECIKCRHKWSVNS
eukprot:tig00021464_g21752.t1